MSTALECRQLTFDYTGHRSQKYHRPVLQHIDAVFASGRITLVSGNSGAGKSTLLHLLAGLMRPVRGEVWADGQPVSRWRAEHRDRWRRQVGILFQQDHLIGDLSALENVMLPLIPRSGKLRRWRDDSRNLLARLNVGALAGTPVDALSGGQRQRVAAARALVAAPDYILADEPVAHQDRDNAGRVGDLLRRAADGGSVVVVAAHDRHVGDWLAVDRHLVLANRSLKPAT